MGKHILAHHDDDTVVVYQAYNPRIAEAAVAAQQLGGGGFSFDRMSWIKPNFLWMMFRSGWASKDNQERILALTLNRAAFDDLLRNAVASSLGASTFSRKADWQQALKRSEVRLQWDPDHDPHGHKVQRRAVQLGLRGDTLRNTVAGDALVRIDDVTPFVIEQRANVGTPHLRLPVETVYVPDDDAAANVGLVSSSLR